MIAERSDNIQPSEVVITQNLFVKFKLFIINFLHETSVHGLVHLVRYGNHIFERLLWWSCIIFAIYGTIWISLRTWTRFQDSPVVIAMDRNMFFWNTSFPSITVCPHKKLDEDKVSSYIEEHPEKFHSDTDIEQFKHFLNILSNTTFENIESDSMNQTFGIESNDFMELIYNLSWPFNPEISSGTAIKLKIQPTVTELGLCYSVNSKVAIYNSYELTYWKKNRWDFVKGNDTVVVHPLDGEIYAQMINLSTSYDVYFHGALEIPEISRQRNTFLITDYTTVEIQALETKTDPSVSELSISQRRCRFPHENEKVIRSPRYSYNQCLMECRLKITFRMCGCIPHFYRPKDKYGKTYPICDLSGWACIYSIKSEIIGLYSKTLKINCDCERNCDASVFFVQAARSRIWFLGANLQWGINDYPKMQLKREMIFAFTDVLVYIGGTAGLFLGCSLLSVTEFVYFLTWRLIKFFLNRKLNIEKR